MRRNNIIIRYQSESRCNRLTAASFYPDDSGTDLSFQHEPNNCFVNTRSSAPEDVVYVEFVNSDKKMLTFIDGNSVSGFFKYERFLKDVAVGEVLKVRFQEYSKESPCKVYTVEKTTDKTLFRKIFQPISGTVRINPGQNFGFLNDAYINTALVAKYYLSNGMQFNGYAMKSYNKKKQEWGLKLI